MKPLIGKLVLPAYIMAMAFLIWAGVDSYRNAASIMKDHTVLAAPIELVSETSRTRRGHTTYTYNFEYHYEVASEAFKGNYSAVNEKGERYLDNPVIEIAYSNASPARSGALHVLSRQAKLGGLIKRLLIVGLIVGFFALLIYGWTMPDDDDEEQEPLSDTVKA